MNPAKEITQTIMDDKRLESDAKKARDLLKEFAGVMAKMEDFAKSCGVTPTDPVNFCRSVLLSYGMKKLDDKIVTLS